MNFFSKFIKMKVDKKREINEIKAYVDLIDIDKDGVISIEDLDSFLSRINFNDFYTN